MMSIFCVKYNSKAITGYDEDINTTTVAFKGTDNFYNKVIDLKKPLILNCRN